jgi:hypothetical protein
VAHPAPYVSSVNEVQRTGAALVPVILHERPGKALVAEATQLVVAIDLGGLGALGGEIILDALARERALHPRPSPVVNLTIVGEDAPRPNEQERDLGRKMGEHLSAFVCIMEGSGVRANWVRGILAAISAFSPRRNPIFVARTIEEGAAIAARELDLDALVLAAELATLRSRAGA